MDEVGGSVLRVGQIRSLFQWSPPWDPHGRDMLQLADVQWYGARGKHDKLGAPQVTRAFHDHAAGNLIRVEKIIPVPICLVPHLQQSSWWQVLFLELP